MTSDRKTVAVFFGGTSFEHDVSVLTGLQTLESIDSNKFDTLPVYISPEGVWYTGSALLDRRNYLLSSETKSKLYQVNPVTSLIAWNKKEDTNKLVLEGTQKGSFLGKKKAIFEVDMVIPALHGGTGENGSIQGLLEVANVPYTGCRVLGSSVCMDKDFSKRVFAALGIPTVPGVEISRPETGVFSDTKELARLMKAVEGPWCVKPCNLGSSVGVYKAETLEDLQSSLASVFKLDDSAVVEKFIPNLVEYNVAVTQAFGKVLTSAIERPIREKGLLSFTDKYLAAGGLETKLSGPVDNSVMSKSRVFHPPELKKAQEKSIREWAEKAFIGFGGCGAVRMDFLCDEKSGEIWINEVNTYPGSLAYYLWEAREEPIIFTDLLSALIEEGFRIHKKQQRTIEPQAGGAAIFKRG